MTKKKNAVTWIKMQKTFCSAVFYREWHDSVGQQRLKKTMQWL